MMITTPKQSFISPFGKAPISLTIKHLNFRFSIKMDAPFKSIFRKLKK